MDINVINALSNVKHCIIETNTNVHKRQLFVLKNKISCRKGCSHCCSMKVQITVAEALIIYQYLLKKKIWKDIKIECKRLLPLDEATDYVTWFSMKLICPILDKKTNTCQAYIVRPVKCSTHFVKSDPKACDPLNIESHSYEPLIQEDIFKEHYEKLFDSIPEKGILTMLLNIPVALLFAEKISIQTNLSLEKALQLMRDEL